MLSGLVHQYFPINKGAPKHLYHKHFVLVSVGSDQKTLPYDFRKKMNGNTTLNHTICENDRVLVSQFNVTMSKFDPDIIVVSNCSRYLVVLPYRKKV